jgi:hypothetical protein
MHRYYHKFFREQEKFYAQTRERSGSTVHRKCYKLHICSLLYKVFISSDPEVQLLRQNIEDTKRVTSRHVTTKLVYEYICLHENLMMEAVNSFETSVNIYPTSRRNVSEERNIHNRRENLKSHLNSCNKTIQSHQCFAKREKFVNVCTRLQHRSSHLTPRSKNALRSRSTYGTGIRGPITAFTRSHHWTLH